ncbi:hypothetical protein N7528_009181 [Penicillium herquei]|nr:hypothetical protein N7528_009181 [Penicillium herquei]
MIKADALQEEQQEQQPSHLPSCQEEKPLTWKVDGCVHCQHQLPVLSAIGKQEPSMIENLKMEIHRTRKLVEPMILRDVKGIRQTPTTEKMKNNNTIPTAALTKMEEKEIGESHSGRILHDVLETTAAERESHESHNAQLSADGVSFTPQDEAHYLRERITELENILSEIQLRRDQERNDWDEKAAKQEADSQKLLSQCQGYRDKIRGAERSAEELQQILSKVKGGMEFGRIISEMQTNSQALRETKTKLEYQVRGQQLEIQSLKRRLMAEVQSGRELRCKYVGSI